MYAESFLIPNERPVLRRISMDPKTIRTRLQELAFLNSKATIWFKASSAKQQPSSNGSAPVADPDAGWEKLHYSGGLREYVQHLNRDNTPMHEPIFIQDEVGRTTAGSLRICATVCSEDVA